MLVGSRNVKSEEVGRGTGKRRVVSRYRREDISRERKIVRASGIFFQARKEGSEIGDGWIALSRSDCGPRYWEYK